MIWPPCQICYTKDMVQLDMICQMQYYLEIIDNTNIIISMISTLKVCITFLLFLRKVLFPRPKNCSIAYI